MAAAIAGLPGSPDPGFALSQALAFGLGGQTLIGQPTMVIMTGLKLRPRQY